MKNISTGTGLALLAGAILAWPVLDRLMPNANAVGIGTTAVSAVAAASTAQGAPTIVWYGISPASSGSGGGLMGAMFRAWSDGRIEYRPFFPSSPFSQSACDLYLGQPVGGCGWKLFSDPASGYSARFDGNSDDSIDGADLGMMLAAWGPVTRNPVPPSDCPLALINP